MNSVEEPPGVHPEGEAILVSVAPNEGGEGGPLPVDTEGGRYHVQWDDGAAFTPMGQLVFFAQFLKASGLFSLDY